MPNFSPVFATDPHRPPGAHPGNILRSTTMPAHYVVKVENPTPAWVKMDANTRLPQFTFIQPQGLSRADALALKRQADITCGGTLRVARVEE